MTKYLPEYGWNPIILTKNSPGVEHNTYNVVYTPFAEHNTLLDLKRKLKLNPAIKVKHSIGLKDKKQKKSFIDILFSLIVEIIGYPDLQKGWYKYAVNASNNLLSHEKVQVVISSSSPVTSHLIAKNISITKDIPWIADLRDLWTQNPYYTHSKLRKFFESKLEKKTLYYSDVLITTTNLSAKKLAELHINKQIYSIPNGFDPEISNIKNSKKLTDKFTISYTGSLYNGKRDPELLFKAISELVAEKKIDQNKIEIRFYGIKQDWMSLDIHKYGLSNIAHEMGVLSRDEILEVQRESQLLLLLIWDNPDEKSVCPGKIYEYLAAHRPILAIGGFKGVVSNLLNETMAGVHTSTVEELKNYLEQYYREYELNGFVFYKGIDRKIQRHSQKEMARKFSMILDELVSHNE